MMLLLLSAGFVFTRLTKSSAEARGGPTKAKWDLSVPTQMKPLLELDSMSPFSISWPGIAQLVLLAVCCMSLNLRAFEPPTADARRAAIGPLDSLSPVLRAALEPDSDFRPIPKPGPDDWSPGPHGRCSQVSANPIARGRLLFARHHNGQSLSRPLLEFRF